MKSAKKKNFRWFIIQFAQQKNDAEYFTKKMLPIIMESKQRLKQVEFDLVYCETAKHSYTLYKARPGQEIVISTIPKKPLLPLIKYCVDSSRSTYDGLMYGGHSNGEKIGLRPIRLSDIQKFGRFLRRHKLFFEVIAFDSCDMGNEVVINQIKFSCAYLLAFPSDAPSHSFMQVPHFYFKSKTASHETYLREIAMQYMKFIRKKYKYPCAVLMNIPKILKSYQLVKQLVRDGTITRFNTKKESADCREKFYTHDQKTAEAIKNHFSDAITDMCGHIVRPCRHHHSLPKNSLHKRECLGCQTSLKNSLQKLA